jgi:type IV secretory pathway VirB2 component (pilin)
VSYLAIIVAGILLLSGRESALSWLLIATVVLLVVSLRNTWDLLVTVADVTQPEQ